jgi:hypothetical protein
MSEVQTKTISRPVVEVIEQRFSCRAYLDQPIDPERQQRLQEYMTTLKTGPMGTAVRFSLMAAQESDRLALRGLGTYGFIKGATGFLVGAVAPGHKNMEDYGYTFEELILFATDLGLGTCWLGGTFTKSSFARKMAIAHEERMPAVASIGLIADAERDGQGAKRLSIGGDRRFDWERLFFVEKFGAPLVHESAGSYATPLEMVRLAPSASNKQPWRIVRQGGTFHFYLQRTPGYRSGLTSKVLNIDDLQRADIGIAMCHFELSARELGLQGRWAVSDPGLAKPDGMTEYIVSWLPS